MYQESRIRLHKTLFHYFPQQRNNVILCSYRKSFFVVAVTAAVATATVYALLGIRINKKYRYISFYQTDVERPGSIQTKQNEKKKRTEDKRLYRCTDAFHMHSARHRVYLRI